MQLKCLALPLLSAALLAACDSDKPAAPPNKAGPKAVADKPAADKPAADKPAPKPLAPAPEGTVIIERLYVDTCAQPTACAELLQDAGVKHCAARTLGGTRWRLPTLAELESWKGNADLKGWDVFHWSGSAWAQDAAQFWIYDPGSAMKTTAKSDRKPFTIRCVTSPDA